MKAWRFHVRERIATAACVLHSSRSKLRRERTYFLWRGILLQLPQQHFAEPADTGPCYLPSSNEQDSGAENQWLEQQGTWAAPAAPGTEVRSDGATLLQVHAAQAAAQLLLQLLRLLPCISQRGTRGILQREAPRRHEILRTCIAAVGKSGSSTSAGRGMLTFWYIPSAMEDPYGPGSCYCVSVCELLACSGIIERTSPRRSGAQLAVGSEPRSLACCAGDQAFTA